MRDEMFEAGYRAGHLQGWRDAMAKVQEQGAPGTAVSPGAGAGPAPASPPNTEGPTAVRGGAAPVPARAALLGPVQTALPVPVPLPAPVPFQPPVPPTAVRPIEAMPSPAPPLPPLPSSAPPIQPPQSPAAAFRQYPETPAERQARRAKRDRQNINITLYVASLLLVAAAALFVGTSLPPVMRFVGVCTVTALFYGAGFVLHARVPRLRPAAVAFTGTGLAMVPVGGLALYNFALPDGPTAWLLTSLIGTAAYAAAAVRLDSRVLVYLSLTFVASTAFSGVCILGGALVWYFAALIGVAVALTCLARARPGWLPPVYVRPLMVLHPYVVPAVAVAATCVPLYLDKAEYALIIALCGLYFALLAVVPGPWRLRNFHAARAALTIAAAVAIWDATGRGSDAFLAACVLFAVQVLGLVLLSDRLSSAFPGPMTRPQSPVTSGAGKSAGTGSANAPVAPPGSGRAPGRWPADASVTFVLQLAATAAFGVAEATASFFRSFTSRGAVPPEGTVSLWVPVALALVMGMVLAIKWPGRNEWPPVGALVLAGLASPVMGAWPLAVMLLVSAGYWAARSVFAAGTVRGRLVLAARIVFTLAVPVTVAAVVGPAGTRDEAAVFALLAALVGQQLLTAVLQLSGVRTLAPEASLGAFGGAGALVLLGLPFMDTSPGHTLTSVALLIQLTAALAAGALLLPRPAMATRWTPTVREALPLGMSLVAATMAFQVVSQGFGNIALVLVTGYLVLTALRLRAEQHRRVYWWLARAAATVLALTAFHQLQDALGTIVIADEAVLPGTILVTVLALQLGLPLVDSARRRLPRWALADTGTMLLIQLVAAATLGFSGNAEWQATSAAVLTALGAAASGYFLRSVTGAVWLVPGAFVPLLVCTGGDLLDIELIFGIFAVFAAVMVVAAPERARKGWYFVAARVLTAALALVLSYDITASPTAVSVTFAMVLAAQHAVRWAMRARLAEVPFQQAAVWITLAGQALLPLVYAVGQGSVWLQTADDGGGRWVVLLELLMLLVSAVVARRFFGARGCLYFTVYAALFGVLSLGPLFTFGGTFLAAAVLSHTGTAAVLLAVALLAVAAGILRRRVNTGTEDLEHWLWLVTAGSFAVAGLVAAALAEDWVPGAAVLVLSAVFFAASHVEGRPVLYPPAVLAALGGAMVLAAEAFPDPAGAWGHFLPWLAGAGTAAAVLYGVRLIRSGPLQTDPARRWSLAGAAFLAVILVALAGFRHDATAWMAVVILAAAVGVAYRETPAGARRIVLEAGALVITAAAQRAAIFALDAPARPGVLGNLPDPFWVAQWYVVLAAALGGLRYLSRNPASGRVLVAVAAGLLSLSSLGVVFGGSGGQQLWVLVLLAALLVAGLVVGERLFVWWGAAGVAACILWAMRNYTFVLLALVAVGLIVFAVWRLNRTSGAAPDAGPGGGLGPAPGPQAPAGNRPAGPDTVADSERSTSWNS